MKFILKTAILASAALAVGACMSSDVPTRLSQTYSCNAGTELGVTYLRNGALVSVDGARAIPFRQTPSTAGQVYENGAMRLARNGNSVTWNTAQKSAPENCRVVNTIN